MKAINTLRRPFLRIDVDRRLDLASELKQFLKAYQVDRIWMFRPHTCPRSWDERHGLHVDDLPYFKNQLALVEHYLGHVDYWNLHGCGMTWTPSMLKALEQEYDRQCLMFLLPMYSLKSGMWDGQKMSPKDVDIKTLAQIIFHPQYIHTEQMDALKILLDRIEVANYKQ